TPAGAIRHAPVIGKIMRIIVTYYPLIRHDDGSGRRIKHMPQLVERNVAGPFTIVRGAVVWQATIPGTSGGNPACTVITDMAVGVGVSEILRWTTVAA